MDIVNRARDNGFTSVLIFEDDVELHPDFERLITSYLSQVPSNWDAIYFGGIHRSDPSPVSENIVRLTETNSTYAYALKSTIYDRFLEINRNPMLPVDETAKRLQKEFACYCFFPHLAWVIQDRSDIQNTEVNHWWLQASLVMDGSEMQAMLRRTTVVLGTGPSRRVADYVAQHYSSVGLDLSPRTMDYIVISDYDIYISPWELKASLMECRDFDRVVPLHRPLPLTVNDTRQLLECGDGQLNTSRYPRQLANSSSEAFCIRRVFSPGRLHVPHNQLMSFGPCSTGSPACVDVSPQLGSTAEMTFHSPSRLLRLSGEL